MMDTKDILAIDVHSHYNYGSSFDTNTTDINEASLTHIQNMYNAANIKRSFLSPFSAVCSYQNICEDNAYHFELAQELDWVYQWVVIDPRNSETFKQARQMLHHPKCVGIKIHPTYHGYSIQDYATEIFSFAAESGSVVLMHPDKPAEMPAVLDHFPEVKLIIAHLGSIEHIQAIRNAKHGNIYTDTSGNASVKNKIIEYAVEQIGSEHILFGTDSYAAGFQRGRIEYALISDEAKMNILRNNALNLFRNQLTEVL